MVQPVQPNIFVLEKVTFEQGELKTYIDEIGPTLFTLKLQSTTALLKNKKTGPQTNYIRTDEAVRQVIRHRFLDPDASEEVIAQKMNQCGFTISERSVQRVISQYGLQKKTIQLPPNKRAPDTDN